MIFTVLVFVFASFFAVPQKTTVAPLGAVPDGNLWKKDICEAPHVHGPVPAVFVTWCVNHGAKPHTCTGEQHRQANVDFKAAQATGKPWYYEPFDCSVHVGQTDPRSVMK
jgi:hypothetical protein